MHEILNMLEFDVSCIDSIDESLARSSPSLLEVYLARTSTWAIDVDLSTKF